MLLAAGFLGWCSSRRPVKPLPSSCEAEGGRFNSFTTHWRLSDHGSFVYRHRTSAPQAGEAGSIPARTTGLDDSTRRVAELVDARASDARAPEAWEFESPPGDSTLQAGRCPAGPHKPGVPGSIPGPGTAGGPVFGRVSYARRRRFDSPTRNCLCSRHGTLTGIAAGLRAWCLWVRIPPVLLTAIRIRPVV